MIGEMKRYSITMLLSAISCTEHLFQFRIVEFSFEQCRWYNIPKRKYKVRASCQLA